MGDIAEYYVSKYSSGRWGIPFKVHQSTPSKDELRDNLFALGVVNGINTVRPKGQVLILTEADETSYFVWKVKGVGKISKKSVNLTSTFETLEEIKKLKGT